MPGENGSGLDAEWAAEFRRQATPALMLRLIKETTALVRFLEKRRKWQNEHSAEDRVQAALVKVLDGTRAWVQEAVDLRGLIMGIVKSDLENELRPRARRGFAVRLDDDATEALEQETSEALADARESKHEPTDRAWWSDAIDELRELAARDVDAIAVLDAFADGHVTKRDVLAATGLSDHFYRAAFARLRELAKRVDPAVRDAVIDAIT